MITVYSKDKCPACDKLIAFLEARSVEHEVMKIGKDIPLADVRQMFPRARGAPVVELFGTYEPMATIYDYIEARYPLPEPIPEPEVEPLPEPEVEPSKKASMMLQRRIGDGSIETISRAQIDGDDTTEGQTVRRMRAVSHQEHDEQTALGKVRGHTGLWKTGQQ